MLCVEKIIVEPLSLRKRISFLIVFVLTGSKPVKGS